MTLVESGTERKEANASLPLANRLMIDDNDSRPMYGEETEMRHAQRTRRDAVRDEEVYVIRFGGEQPSDDRSVDGTDAVISEKCRFNGTFFFCRRCGQFFIQRIDLLRHWAICNVHDKSCHVVERSCQTVNRIIEMKHINIAHHPESNPILMKIKVTPEVKTA